jgi:hypothetical protein
MVPVDLILGRTFLKNFRLSFDMANGFLTINPQVKRAIATTSKETKPKRS